MDRLTKNALSILVNFAFCANQLLAQLPPITFEAVEWVPYQPVGNGVQPDWQLFCRRLNASSKLFSIMSAR